jgi:hypothetical protein
VFRPAGSDQRSFGDDSGCNHLLQTGTSLRLASPSARTRFQRVGERLGLLPRAEAQVGRGPPVQDAPEVLPRSLASGPIREEPDVAVVEPRIARAQRQRLPVGRFRLARPLGLSELAGHLEAEIETLFCRRGVG